MNAHYIVLLRNPADKLQVDTLSRQVFPKNQRFLIEAFADATIEPYSYLFLNLHPKEPDDRLRVAAKIFDHPPIIYLPKKCIFKYHNISQFLR